ncbi:hypothetical protein MKX03_023745, partial [Papaver bracteatum]
TTMVEYIIGVSDSLVWYSESKLYFAKVVNQRSQEVDIVFHNASCKKFEQRRLSFILEPVFVDDLQ